MADSLAMRIERAVSSWDGVTAAPHRFGGIEFRVGRRELGHLHGSRLADLPFPISVRDALLAAGRAERHHILPDSGWVSVRIRNDQDALEVIELFRLNYHRPWLAAKATSPGTGDLNSGLSSSIGAWGRISDIAVPKSGSRHMRGGRP